MQVESLLLIKKNKSGGIHENEKMQKISDEKEILKSNENEYFAMAEDNKNKVLVE